MTIRMTERHFRHAPKAWQYMGAALWHRKSLSRATQAAAPAMRWQWHGLRWPEREVRALQSLTGLAPGPYLYLLLPQVLGFRLVMAALTDAAFPLPIWNALQIRNRLRLHASWNDTMPLDLSTHTAAWRSVPKGVELDLHTQATQNGRCVWEGTTTFYYRGVRWAALPAQPDALPAPVCEGPEVARWRAGQGEGWAFGHLTGDYNGVHWSHAYARRLGFPRAFLHPARVLGQCLARLPEQTPAGGGPLGLDAWIKGPVPYGAELHLRTCPVAQGLAFALHTDADPRPAHAGRIVRG